VHVCTQLQVRDGLVQTPSDVREAQLWMVSNNPLPLLLLGGDSAPPVIC
jgi:hypothetical protein